MLPTTPGFNTRDKDRPRLRKKFENSGSQQRTKTITNTVNIGGKHKYGPAEYRCALVYNCGYTNIKITIRRRNESLLEISREVYFCSDGGKKYNKIVLPDFSTFRTHGKISYQ